jgi:hypothetical protein
MEDKESLKSGTAVGELADAVQDDVNNLLSNGVMTTGVIVGGVFLSRDDLLGMVELGVLSGADFVADGGLQIDKDGSRDVFAGRGLAEKGVEGIVGNTKRSVRGHFSVLVDAVLEAVKLPAVVTNLDTGLAEMNRDAF